MLPDAALAETIPAPPTYIINGSFSYPIQPFLELISATLVFTITVPAFPFLNRYLPALRSPSRHRRSKVGPEPMHKSLGYAD